MRSLFHRHGKSIGITLFRSGRLQIELWLCLEDVEPHVHHQIDSTIIWIGGRMLGTIGGRSKELGWRQLGHRYAIPAKVKHSAKIHTFGLFANIERWKTDPTSAAIDFHV